MSTRCVRCTFLGVGLLLSMILVGCGPTTTSVTGKVVFDGKPVDGGSISFIPVAGGGKPGEATIRADGTFTAACISGKNRVLYSPPPAEKPAENLKPGATMPESKYGGLVAKAGEVEMKGSAMTVDVELVTSGPVVTGGDARTKRKDD